MSATCSHVEAVRDDWPPLAEPACEDCVAAGRRDWVSLRRCLSCGHVGCCDSSPGTHASAHHHATEHPVVRAIGQDWVWCYVDEATLRHEDGGWVDIDLFYEAGLAFMREHLADGGDPGVARDHVHGKGFPLGAWVAEMRRRHAAGELSPEQAAALESLPAWRWDG
jgi:hypothetical protein